MCGIAGLHCFNPVCSTDDHAALVSGMCALQHHRGPDDRATESPGVRLLTLTAHGQSVRDNLVCAIYVNLSLEIRGRMPLRGESVAAVEQRLRESGS